jgi:teichoic acid transport system permease protein
MAQATTQVPPLAKLGVRPRVRDYARSLWDRRQFAMAIPTAQLQAQHRNSVLGGLWHILDPLISVLVWWIMFGVILNLTRGVDNLVGFLAVGVFVFHFTTNAVKSGARALVSNEGLIRAISFPRAILPLSVVVSELMALGYAFVAMFVIVLITGEEPSLVWLTIVPIVALQLLFNAGLALFMARVGDRFRDVLQVLPYGLRVWGMLSGIFAPIARRLGDHPTLLQITLYNPGFLYMNMARNAILENQLPAAREWITITIWGIASLVIGFLFFLGKEQEYGRG